MPEFLQRLDRLFLKLDHTALLVEQSLADVLYALEHGTAEDAEIVIRADDVIDAREVETERECVRLLALFQPAAIDLRRICFVIKVNNDLERMADFCVNMAKSCIVLKEEGVSITTFSRFQKLAQQVSEALRKTIRLFSPQRENGNLIESAKAIIEADEQVIDVTFREFLEEVFSEENTYYGRMNVLAELTSLGRALERIGDHCTNIAEDAVFMLSGEIIRHLTVS